MGYPERANPALCKAQYPALIPTHATPPALQPRQLETRQPAKPRRIQFEAGVPHAAQPTRSALRSTAEQLPLMTRI